MGYSKDILNKASEKMAERRNKALRIADINRNKAYEQNSRILEIERELASLGASAGKAVLSKGNTKEILRNLKERSLMLQDELSRELFKIGMTGYDLEPEFYCKKCSDTGYCEKDGITVTCDCLKKLRSDIAIEELNNSSPLKLSSFETFDLSKYSMDEGTYRVSPYKRMHDIYYFCKEYAENFGKDSGSLLMKGATGLGKTHLSLAIANELIKNGWGVVYVSAPTILSKLEKAHFSYGRNTGENEEDNILSVLLDCDLLIIDDLGTEFSSPYSTSTLYNIFNSRILENKPIIFSTNFSMQELENSYSNRFTSRVLGYCTKLDFIGNDLRVPHR